MMTDVDRINIATRTGGIGRHAVKCTLRSSSDRNIFNLGLCTHVLLSIRVERGKFENVGVGKRQLMGVGHAESPYAVQPQKIEYGFKGRICRSSI